MFRRASGPGGPPLAQHDRTFGLRCFNASPLHTITFRCDTPVVGRRITQSPPIRLHCCGIAFLWDRLFVRDRICVWMDNGRIDVVLHPTVHTSIFHILTNYAALVSHIPNCQHDLTGVLVSLHATVSVGHFGPIHHAVNDRRQDAVRPIGVRMGHEVAHQACFVGIRSAA